MKLISPADGEKIKSTSVTLTWEGIAGNKYEVILSTDPEFENKNSKHRSNIKTGQIAHSAFLYFLPLLLIIPFVKRKPITYSSITILLVVFFSTQCKNNNSPTPEVQVIEMTETFDKLLPNTTYYWKVKAHAKNQDDFHSETLVRSFITE